MAALTAALAALTIGSTVSRFASDRRDAKTAQQQGDYEAQLYGMNAGLAEEQSRDAIARGHEAELKSRSGSRQLIGSQRAALAAQGIALDSGSAVDVVENDAALGELDALTIRNNAKREAWGFQTQATQYRQQGELARTSGRNTAKALRNRSVSTLLSGAGDLFSVYQSYGKTSAGRTRSSSEYGRSTYSGNSYGMLG